MREFCEKHFILQENYQRLMRKMEGKDALLTEDFLKCSDENSQ